MPVANRADTQNSAPIIHEHANSVLYVASGQEVISRVVACSGGKDLDYVCMALYAAFNDETVSAIVTPLFAGHGGPGALVLTNLARHALAYGDTVKEGGALHSRTAVLLSDFNLFRNEMLSLREYAVQNWFAQVGGFSLPVADSVVRSLCSSLLSCFRGLSLAGSLFGNNALSDISLESVTSGPRTQVPAPRAAAADHVAPRVESFATSVNDLSRPLALALCLAFDRADIKGVIQNLRDLRCSVGSRELLDLSVSSLALNVQKENGNLPDDGIDDVLACFGRYRQFLADICCYELDIWNALFCAGSYTNTYPSEDHVEKLIRALLESFRVMCLRGYLFPATPAATLQLATCVSAPDQVQATVPLLNLVVESVSVAVDPLRRGLAALNESTNSMDDRVEDVEDSLSTLLARLNSLAASLDDLRRSHDSVRLQTIAALPAFDERLTDLERRFRSVDDFDRASSGGTGSYSSDGDVDPDDNDDPALDSSDDSGTGGAPGDGGGGGGGGAQGADRSSVVHESDYDSDDVDEAAAPAVLSPPPASGLLADLHVLRLGVHQPPAAWACEQTPVGTAARFALLPPSCDLPTFDAPPPRAVLPPLCMPADHMHSPLKLVNTASPPQDLPALNAGPRAAAAPSAPQPVSPALEAVRPASIEGTQASPTKPLAPTGAQLPALPSVHALPEVQADCTPTANTLAVDALNSGMVTSHTPSTNSPTATHAHAALCSGTDEGSTE
jgi:hypothetical protein